MRAVAGRSEDLELMARSVLPENAILLGLEKKGGQLPLTKLPKPKGSDREKLLETLSTKSLVRLDGKVVVLTESGAARVREIQEGEQREVDEKAEARRKKKEAADAAKKARADAAAKKKAVAAAEKRRKAAIKTALGSLASLLQNAKKMSARGVKPAERLRRAREARDGLSSEILPRLGELIVLLDDQARDLRGDVERTLRELGRQIRIPDLRMRLGASREELHPLLRSMARAEVPLIDLEIAADPSSVPDPAEGIRTEDGLLYFVSIRR